MIQLWHYCVCCNTQEEFYQTYIRPLISRVLKSITSQFSPSIKRFLCHLSNEHVVNIVSSLLFLKLLWLKWEEAEDCGGELTVVGWLSGQRVTLGCPGAQKREVSCSRGWRHIIQIKHRKCSSHITYSFVLFLFFFLCISAYSTGSFLFATFDMFFSSLFTSAAPPSPPLISLVEDRVGGGLLAFLHRVLCARPGLGSGPYPLSTLSRFSDSHPSSSFPLNTPPTSSTPLGCFPNCCSCQQLCALQQFSTLARFSCYHLS